MSWSLLEEDDVIISIGELLVLVLLHTHTHTPHLTSVVRTRFLWAKPGETVHHRQAKPCSAVLACFCLAGSTRRPFASRKLTLSIGACGDMIRSKIQVRGQQQFFTVCVVTATQPNYKEILAYYMIPWPVPKIYGIYYNKRLSVPNV